MSLLARLTLVALLLFLPSLAGAQQTVTVGPVTTAMKLEWKPGQNVNTQAIANRLEARLRINNGSPIVLAKTCVASGNPQAPFTCTAQLTQGIVDALNVIGSHSLTVRLYDPDTKLEGGFDVPFPLPSPPGAATGTRITQ